MNICCGFTVEAERERRVCGGECGSYQHLGQLLALGSPLRSPGETLGTRIRIWSSDTEQIALERVFLSECAYFFPFLFSFFFSKEDQNDS